MALTEEDLVNVPWCTSCRNLAGGLKTEAGKVLRLAKYPEQWDPVGK